MEQAAKILVIVGIFFVLAGAGLYFFGKIPGMGKLPGDILVKKDNFTFYFPITTCLILSAILSFILFLWHRR